MKPKTAHRCFRHQWRLRRRMSVLLLYRPEAAIPVSAQSGPRFPTAGHSKSASEGAERFPALERVRRPSGDHIGLPAHSPSSVSP
jgi:hypothetical protein